MRRQSGSFLEAQLMEIITVLASRMGRRIDETSDSLKGTVNIFGIFERSVNVFANFRRSFSLQKKKTSRNDAKFMQKLHEK